MKKFTKVTCLLLLIVFLMMTSVYAEDEPCRISLTVSKTKLKPGDKVTVNVIMSNIEKEEGIKSIRALLNISTDVFDIEFEDSEEAEELAAQFEAATEDEGGEVGVLYVGENDTENSDNKWNALLYTDDSNEIGIMSFNEDTKKETQTVAKLHLVVKDDADEEKTEISLENIEVYGSDENSEDVEDSNTLTFTIDLGEEIQEEEEEEEEPISRGTQTTGSQSSGSSNTAVNTNPSDRGAPYTGIEDYFPSFVVILLLATAMSTFYIYYKEYKNKI